MEANNAVVAVADAAVRSIVVERRRRRSRRFNLGELGSQHPPIERLPLRLAVTVSPDDELERVGKQRAAHSKAEEAVLTRRRHRSDLPRNARRVPNRHLSATGHRVGLSRARWRSNGCSARPPDLRAAPTPRPLNSRRIPTLGPRKRDHNCCNSGHD